MNLKVQKWEGELCIKILLLCCSFIYTVLTEVIFSVVVQCIAISFGVRFGKSQLLLLHCKPNALSAAWRVGTVENTLLDVTYDFIPLNSFIEWSQFFLLRGWELNMLEFLRVLIADIPLKTGSRMVTLSQHQDYIQTAIENCNMCARKTSLNLQKDLMHAGVHICSSTMRRRPLEAGRKVRKSFQATAAILDMEVANVESLLTQLVALRDSWKQCGMKLSLLHPAFRQKLNCLGSVISLPEKEWASMMRILYTRRKREWNRWILWGSPLPKAYILYNIG